MAQITLWSFFSTRNFPALSGSLATLGRHKNLINDIVIMGCSNTEEEAFQDHDTKLKFC